MRTPRSFLIGFLMALMVMFAASHPVQPVQALRDRKALLPTADAMMRSYSPDTNEGRAVEFWVMSNSEVVLSFMMFDLSQLPAGAAIEEATLRLFEAEESGTSNGTVNVHYCPNNDWTEFGITYNNKRAFETEPIDSVNVTSNYRWYEWNVTSIAASILKGQDKRLSLALEGNTDGRIIAFYSRQSPAVDKRPQLSVLYSYTPSSGVDPVLIGLVAVGILTASAVVLELVFIRRKKRKQTA